MTINDSMAFVFSYDGYQISDEADKVGDPTIKYYLYLNKNGDWRIMQRNLATKAYRYKKGSAPLGLFWSQRESLTYELFSEMFA